MVNRILFYTSIAIFWVSCKQMTEKEFFDKVVYDAYHTKYDGVIVAKYIAENNHNRHIIELNHELFGMDKIDFTFQSYELFEQFKVGDTILKQRESTKIRIKRKGLDTIVKLDFLNVKGDNKYYENPYLLKEMNKK